MIGSIIDGIGKSVTGITASIVALRKMKKGDQAERDRMAVESTLGAQKQLVAEFTRADRNWYDTLISAINRVPRPAMVFLTVAYFVYSFYSPQEFAVINEGLATVPDQMWYVLLTIISFYFGSRHLEKRLINKRCRSLNKSSL